MARRLLVKVTCGADDAERLSQALTVAATAVASGVDVSLWLTGDATWLAVPGRVPDLGLDGAAPLSDLVDAVLAGGRTRPAPSASRGAASRPRTCSRRPDRRCGVVPRGGARRRRPGPRLLTTPSSVGPTEPSRLTGRPRAHHHHRTQRLADRGRRDRPDVHAREVSSAMGTEHATSWAASRLDDHGRHGVVVLDPGVDLDLGVLLGPPAQRLRDAGSRPPRAARP